MADPTPWRDALPEELKNEPSLQDFKDVAAVAKSYVEARKLLGASIRPPGPDAAPEAKKEFREKMLKLDSSLVFFPDDAPPEVTEAVWKRLGRPEKLEEYAPADGAEVALEDLRNLAKVTGMTKAQFKALTEVMGKTAAAQKQSLAQAQAALKTEYGAAYEERVLSAKALAMKMGLSEQELAALPPAQLKAWATVAKAVGENPTTLKDTLNSTKPGRLTPAEAQLQINEIMRRPEYFDRARNPLVHEELKAKVEGLMAQVYPEG